MICPKCGSESGVVDSRPYGTVRRRRYRCDRCQHRFNTVEVILPEGMDAGSAVILHEAVINARIHSITKTILEDVAVLFNPPDQP